MGRVNQRRTASSEVDHQETKNRTHEGDSLSPSALEADASITNARYATKDDVPTDLPAGTQVYVEDEGKLYIEDGA